MKSGSLPRVTPRPKRRASRTPRRSKPAWKSGPTGSPSRRYRRSPSQKVTPSAADHHDAREDRVTRVRQDAAAERATDGEQQEARGELPPHVELHGLQRAARVAHPVLGEALDEGGGHAEIDERPDHRRQVLDG